jgi:hypothetical protein
MVGLKIRPRRAQVLIAPGLVGTLIKNRQFLAKPAGMRYCFSERLIDPLALFRGNA